MQNIFAFIVILSLSFFPASVSKFFTRMNNQKIILEENLMKQAHNTQIDRMDKGN